MSTRLDKERERETLLNPEETPTAKMGIGGNWYVYSTRYEKVEEICKDIGKSINSIYYNYKYSCFAIRIKSKKHREALSELFTESD